MKENLRGLFYIVKGHYVKNKAPRFWNEVSASYNDIGGYDPEREDTEEWYMVFDNEEFRFHGSSTTLQGAANIIRRIILKHKTKEHYFTTLEQYENMVSPIYQRLHQEVYNTYGDYFKQFVSEVVEESAYREVRNNTPVMKARNKKKRSLSKVVEMVEVTPPQTIEVNTLSDTSTPKPKRGKGLKPIKRKVTAEME